MTIDVLKQEGLKLDKLDRKELAYFLLDSLLDDVLTAEQQTELDRRMDAFERGDMEVMPGETFEAELKARHGL